MIGSTQCTPCIYAVYCVPSTVHNLGATCPILPPGISSNWPVYFAYADACEPLNPADPNNCSIGFKSDDAGHSILVICSNCLPLPPPTSHLTPSVCKCFVRQYEDGDWEARYKCERYCEIVLTLGLTGSHFLLSYVTMSNALKSKVNNVTMNTFEQNPRRPSCD